jgi:hypothetical protein
VYVKAAAVWELSASASANASSSSSRLWAYLGLMLLRHGHALVMVISGLTFLFAPFDTATGDTDMAFFFTLCCSGGILSLPVSVTLTLAFYLAWVLCSATGLWLGLLVAVLQLACA